MSIWPSNTLGLQYCEGHWLGHGYTSAECGNSSVHFFRTRLLSVFSTHLHYIDHKCTDCLTRIDQSNEMGEDLSSIGDISQRDGLKKHWYELKLNLWRKEKMKEHFPNSHMQYIPSIILSDQMLITMAGQGSYIKDEASLAKVANGGWSTLSQFSSELLDILHRGQGMDVSEGGEMYEAWRQHVDKQEGRIPDDPITVQRQQFNQRKIDWVIRNGYSLEAVKHLLPDTPKAGKETKHTLGSAPVAEPTRAAEMAIPTTREEGDDISPALRRAQPKKRRKEVVSSESEDSQVSLEPELSRSGRKRTQPWLS